MDQQFMPLEQREVRPEEVARKKSLGGAIELCAEIAGFELDKELQLALKVDKSQFSRWQSGQEGIKWDKLVDLMNVCGNDAPLLWMLHNRGYDLYSVRRKETKLEKENRELRERLAAMEHERETERRLFRDLRVGV